MDIVGLLDGNAGGNWYMFVICDYDFPLNSMKARQFANCLLQFFSRVGITREVLTDCGSNFLYKLLRQVYKLLGKKGD